MGRLSSVSSLSSSSLSSSLLLLIFSLLCVSGHFSSVSALKNGPSFVGPSAASSVISELSSTTAKATTSIPPNAAGTPSGSGGGEGGGGSSAVCSILTGAVLFVEPVLEYMSIREDYLEILQTLETQVKNHESTVGKCLEQFENALLQRHSIGIVNACKAQQDSLELFEHSLTGFRSSVTATLDRVKGKEERVQRLDKSDSIKNIVNSVITAGTIALTCSGAVAFPIAAPMLTFWAFKTAADAATSTLHDYEGGRLQSVRERFTEVLHSQQTKLQELKEEFKKNCNEETLKGSKSWLSIDNAQKIVKTFGINDVGNFLREMNNFFAE